MIEKGSVVFKYRPEDFIVEEIINGKACEVSADVDVFNARKTSLGNLKVDERRDFLGCDMEKIGIDHLSAISELTRQLGRGEYQIGYAGTKDKEAWTCQRLTIFDPNIEKVQKFSHSLILLKNFKWEKHKLKIGDLDGNRFKIVLRDADKDAIKVLNRIRNTKEIGNFFGGQRFGSLRKDNFSIGKLILKRKFHEAVFAFLTGYGDSEDDETKRAKKRLKEEKDILAAEKYFPENLAVERKIISHLKENPDDWLGALHILGEKSLLIMCQSVQSKIFNDILEICIDRDLRADTVIIPGYNSKFSQGPFGKIEKAVMEEHELAFHDFDHPIPFLRLSGSHRKASLDVRDIDIRIEDDEIFIPGKKIVLSFVLESGSYATTFLENFFDLRSN